MPTRELAMGDRIATYMFYVGSFQISMFYRLVVDCIGFAVDCTSPLA